MKPFNLNDNGNSEIDDFLIKSDINNKFNLKYKNRDLI